jgi:hypothetical protein
MAGPYELQSPKDIAMEYGGNKQKIAQAAQMGLVDPTAAVLAGMFIDKMRTAQQEEAAPNQTVAQQTFAPTQMAMAPAGLGATPEGQQMAPQMQQAPVTAAEGGLMALDVPGDMYDGYAGGGIIAFANGGMPINYEDEIFKSGLGQQFREREMLREKVLGKDQSVADLMSYIQGLEGKSGERAERMFNLRLAQAGLGIAAGQSPYALQNISAGAMPALEAGASDIAKREEAELGRKKVLAELGGKERAERAKSFEGLLDEEAKTRAANIAANKPTDMRAYVRDTELAAMGDPAAARRVAAVEKYLPMVGTSGVRAEAAVQQAQTAEARVAIQDRQKAAEAVDKAVGPGGDRNLQKEYNARARADRLANEKSGAQPGDPNYSNKAEEFKEGLIEKRLRTPEPKPSDAKPTAAPAGIPPGAKQVGTSGGKPVYQLPNGKLVIQQ